MESIVQSAFDGGINLFNSDSKIAENEYVVGFNVRARTSSIESVKKPIEDTAAPFGLKQGIYAFDQYLLLFSSGLAYYKTIGSDTWTKINDLYVEATEPYIYVQPVPASIINKLRKLTEDDKINGSSVNPSVTTGTLSVNGTISGLVVQDGKLQPWLIKSDASALRLNTYLEWQKTDREYVPIGRNMAFLNGKLFVLSPDKKRIYHSVSGRPLDFVVNVDILGNKGGDSETTAYAVSYDEINCLIPLNTGELLAGTKNACFPIELSYEITIFQEPTFLNLRPFIAGVTNQFSFIDILGDYAFIDFDGIRSFNAVSTLRNEGRNSIFSSRIASAFLGKKQSTTTAAIVFDNYSLFSVLTTYGNVLAVFDNTRQTWVSFDLLKDITNPIKQFAIANEATSPILYGITSDKVYKLYSSSTFEEAKVQFKAINSGRAKPELKLKNIRTVFEGSRTEAIVTTTSIVNNRRTKRVREKLTKSITGILYPCDYPVTYFGNGDLDNIRFNFEQLSSTGYKISPEVKWANEAKLNLVETDVEFSNFATSKKQQGVLYKG